MATLCARITLSTIPKNILFPTVRCVTTKVTMGDPIEHATGLERKELQAELDGIDDPFDTKIIKRGPGTKDKPILIPSAFDARIIGCICEEEQNYVNWMWLYKGEPKRCECGYWFNLTYKKSFE